MNILRFITGGAVVALATVAAAVDDLRITSGVAVVLLIAVAGLVESCARWP